MKQVLTNNLFATAILLLIFSISVSAEKLSLGVEDAWIPYSNPDGTGMSNELVKAAYQAVGIDVKLEIRPYARLLNEIESGRLVGGFNVARESSTEPLFRWGTERLFLEKAHYYYQKDRPLKATSASELVNGERIGVIRDYEYGDQFFNNDKIEKNWVATPEQNIRKLMNSRLDAIILSERTANKLLKELKVDGEILPAFESESDYIYVVFSLKHPDSTHYMQKFDEGLKIIKSNGIYDAILKRY